MRADAKANRDRIITAAQELFLEQGADVAFRTIAARAEVGVATVHRNFPDRLSLFFAISDNIYENLQLIVEKHQEQWALNPWKAWNGVIYDIAHLGLIPLIDTISQVVESSNYLEQAKNYAENRDLRTIENLLSSAASHGFVTPDLSPFQFGMGIGAVSRPLPAMAEHLIPQQRQWLCDVFIAGLRAQAHAQASPTP